MATIPHLVSAQSDVVAAPQLYSTNVCRTGESRQADRSVTRQESELIPFAAPSGSHFTLL